VTDLAAYQPIALIYYRISQSCRLLERPTLEVVGCVGEAWARLRWAPAHTNDKALEWWHWRWAPSLSRFSRFMPSPF